MPTYATAMFFRHPITVVVSALFTCVHSNTEYVRTNLVVLFARIV
jgi:hypothetical protein